jgi:heme A synthase
VRGRGKREGEAVIHFIVTMLLLLIVLWVVKLVIDEIPLPPKIKTIAWVVVGLVFLLILLSYLGLYTPGPAPSPRWGW